MRLTKQQFLALARKVGDCGQVPNYQSCACSVTPAKAEAQGYGERTSAGCYRIVVQSFRYRKIDPDNIWAKWYIDQLVEAGILSDDSCDIVSSIEYQVRLVEKGQQEKTVIEVWSRC